MNEHHPTSSIAHYIFIVLLGLISCSPIVDPTDSGKDYFELESVWQYLSIYSIYQDRVPTDPFKFDSPQDLFDAISDTLKGGHYTGYDETDYSTASAASGRIAMWGNSIIRVDSLTDSIAVIRIKTFDDQNVDVCGPFRFVLPVLGRFPKIIVDLRLNGGGSLYALDTILCSFLPLGTPYIQEKYRQKNETTKLGETVDWDTAITRLPPDSRLVGKKFAVIMDNFSASASEIFAAGLKDGANAHLVGETSYGKAIGQVFPTRIGKPTIRITFLKLRGLTSRIGSYQNIGIDPDTVSAATVYVADNSGIQDYDKHLFYAARKLDGSITPQDVPWTWSVAKSANVGLNKSGAFIVIPPDTTDKNKGI